MKRKLLTTVLVLVGFLVPVPGIPSEANRDEWQQPEKVMDAIGVKPGMVIGEAGAGEGYFTFKLARRVGPTGKIYANDISDDALDTLGEHIEDESITNIETIRGEVEDPLFPAGGLDMAFMCYVLHDLSKPVAFLKNLKPSLKPGATLVILERDPGKYPGSRWHFWKKEKVLRVVKDGGFKLVRIETFLSRDHIYIFRPEREE